MLAPRSMEELEYEIDIFEKRMVQYMLSPLLYKDHEVGGDADFDQEARMDRFMEGVYAEYNKKCITGENTYCDHCNAQFDHQLSHHMVADVEGWGTDHHNYISDAGWDGCWLCPAECDQGDCGLRKPEELVSQEWRDHSKKFVIVYSDVIK